MEKNLTVREVAKLVSYSARQIRQMCIGAKVSGAYKLPGGRKWLIPESALETIRKGEARKPGVKKRPEKLTFSSQEYLKRHYGELSELVTRLNSQLFVPKLSELCLLELKDGTPISYGYGDAPNMKYVGQVIALDVEQSDQFFWQCFEEHLKVEVAEFDTSFRGWKQSIGHIVQTCHDISEIIAGQLAEPGWQAAEPYLSPDSKDYGPGVYYDIVVKALYECVVFDYAPQFGPWFAPNSSALSPLVMEHPSGRKAVARGADIFIDAVKQRCLSIAGCEELKNTATEVHGLVQLAEGHQKTIKSWLQLMLRRGTFKGVCAICSELIS